MKKLTCLLFLLILASPASATVYRWVDQTGTVNFTDDYSKVPLAYQDSVQETNVPKAQRPAPSQVSVKQPLQSTQQAPPIPQALIREGDFAVNLAEALRLGRTSNEAEAETLLASVGISPKNGWIADYPVTPDIIGELQNSINAAADSGKLAMNKEAAMKALQDLNVQQGLPVSAGIQNQGTEPEPEQSYGEYSNPEVINNYYYEQGPPIVTYYPPPPDYGYLYSWISYPFWCSGFWFPGYFILNDFHRPIHGHGRPCFVSNHYRDHGSHGVHTVDPVTRHDGRGSRGGGDLSHGRGFHSGEARNGAASIYGRSYERSRHGNAPNGANSTGSGGRPQAGHSANRGNGPAASYSRARGPERPSSTWGNRGEVGLRGSGGRPSSQQSGFEGHSRAPSAGGNRSFSPPLGGVGRSFTSPSMGSNRSFTAPSAGSRSSSSSSFSAPSTGGQGSFGSFHGGGYSGGFHGGGGFSGSYGGGHGGAYR